MAPKHAVSLEIQEYLTFNEVVSSTTKKPSTLVHVQPWSLMLNNPKNAAIYLHLVLYFAQTRSESLPDCESSTSYLFQLAEIRASVNAD